jgi:hypothetical protein
MLKKTNISVMISHPSCTKCPAVKSSWSYYQYCHYDFLFHQLAWEVHALVFFFKVGFSQQILLKKREREREKTRAVIKCAAVRHTSGGRGTLYTHSSTCTSPENLGLPRKSSPGSPLEHLQTLPPWSKGKHTNAPLRNSQVSCRARRGGGGRTRCN